MRSLATPSFYYYVFQCALPIRDFDYDSEIDITVFIYVIFYLSVCVCGGGGQTTFKIEPAHIYREKYWFSIKTVSEGDPH